MAVSDAERQHLYRTLTDTLGQRDADTLMNLTPSHDVDDLATRSQVDALRDHFDEKFRMLDERLRLLDEKYTAQFDAINDRFNAVTARFDVNDRRMAQLVTRDEFAEMKADLTRSLSALIVASYVGVTAIFSTILAIFV